MFFRQKWKNFEAWDLNNLSLSYVSSHDAIKEYLKISDVHIEFLKWKFRGEVTWSFLSSPLLQRNIFFLIWNFCSNIEKWCASAMAEKSNYTKENSENNMAAVKTLVMKSSIVWKYNDKEIADEFHSKIFLFITQTDQSCVYP